MDKSPEAFRTISEVAELLETPAHVLRFWESRFPQIRPVKRAGGRRYYRPADVALLAGIKRLLHDEGMTIRGVQKILREQGTRHVSGLSDEMTPEEEALEAAMAARFDNEPGLSADQAEARTAAALEAAMAETRGVVLPFPPATDPVPVETVAVEVPEEAPASVDSVAESPASEDVAMSAPEAVDAPCNAPTEAVDEVAEAAPAIASPAPVSPQKDQQIVMDWLEAQPEPSAGKPVATAAPEPAATGESPDPAVLAAETATLAARLRALPHGSLAARRPQLAELATRIAALRNQLVGAPPHG